MTRSRRSKSCARSSVDEARYDETDQLFTEDVTVTSLRGEAHGVVELVALVRAGHDRYARTLHHKANLVVELDGDAATVRAHDLAVFVVDDDSESIAAAVHRYGPRREPRVEEVGGQPTRSAATMSSTRCFASPKSMAVFSRKNSGFCTPA
ncbi:nuclear transport factor 2 family protein [Cellulosimicrobium cellulans]|uniref:nuclear transport factor 2 family protein n=1 Tax=Cellulosimicrobium cellulans TaxID=1710 RepID=UPI002407471A|nr:nuclear transport factor 2 family protein [Cellulosimicrobium cellulans]MDF9875901.1 hypothetical protein [Cellulosimicrobium cellulans]